MSVDPRWYVVQTQPHAEAKAAAHLIRQGYTIYLPRYLKQRRHARRVEVVAAPLFPRYLFVAVDHMTQRWRSIQSTLGVSHLVCNGEEPATISAGVIGELQSREDERGLHPSRFAPALRQRRQDSGRRRRVQHLLRDISKEWPIATAWPSCSTFSAARSGWFWTENSSPRRDLRGGIAESSCHRVEAIHPNCGSVAAAIPSHPAVTCSNPSPTIVRPERKADFRCRSPRHGGLSLGPPAGERELRDRDG